MPDRAYADSSFLVSIYRQDGNSAGARDFMAKHSPALVFSSLHRVELRNALRFAETQGLISIQERRQAFKQIEHDLRDGFLAHTTMAWSDLCRRADDLSERHMQADGQRTIDLLHVAAALECGGKTLSFVRSTATWLGQGSGLGRSSVI